MRAVALSLLLLACSSDEALDRGVPTVDYSALPVLLEFGHRMDQGGDALLFRPLDAAFLGDTLVVLDNIPPWLRLYDSIGGFLEARVQRGDGPGELRAAYALSTTSKGDLLLAHPRGALVLGPDGVPGSNLVVQDLWVRGVVEGCEGEILAFASPVGVADGEGVVGRVGGVSGGFDEILTLGRKRPTAGLRRVPPFLNRHEGGVVLFTEEFDNPRIVRLDCEGAITSEVAVSQLGSPEAVFDAAEPGRPGRIGVRGATPPLPAGFAETAEGLLWVSLEVEARPDNGADSLTVFRILGPEGTRRSLRVKGWLMLHDQNPEGHLLMSDSYGATPRMLLVDGGRLLSQFSGGGGH